MRPSSLSNSTSIHQSTTISSFCSFIPNDGQILNSEIQELIDGFQCSCNGYVVFQFESDWLICEGFEEGEDELSRRKRTERIEVRDEG